MRDLWKLLRHLFEWIAIIKNINILSIIDSIMLFFYVAANVYQQSVPYRYAKYGRSHI